MKRSLILIVSLFVSGFAFAGERTVVLHCGSPITQADGEFLMGGASSVKVVMDTNHSILVGVEGHAVIPNPTINYIPAQPKGDARNLYETADGEKVYLFRENNCLKSKITAILMGGTSDISNCTNVSDDKMVGEDYEFCKYP